MKSIRNVILISVILGLGPRAMPGQMARLSSDLRKLAAAPEARVNVIVQYRAAPSAADKSRIAALGGVQRMDLPFIRAALFEVSNGQLAALAQDAGVAYVSTDRTVSALLDTVAPAVSAPAAWQYGWDGAGVGVAVIDSGIAESPDLRGSRGSRIVYREVFRGRAGDEYGHGTHVAGIIAGNGASSDMPGATHVLRGIAPNANLIDLEVLDQNGVGSDSAVIAAIQRAIQLKDTYHIRVINLSLGRPVMESCSVDPLCRAVEAAWKAGIVVVTAAGNLGRNSYATIMAPGNSPYVITVGAMKTMTTPARADDQLASYSSKGPTYLDLVVKPDLVAPGNLVASLAASPLSTLVRQNPGNPRSRFRRVNSDRISAWVITSRALVASSASSSAGPCSRARAIRTRCA
jgi:serine protease AprX